MDRSQIASLTLAAVGLAWAMGQFIAFYFKLKAIGKQVSDVHTRLLSPVEEGRADPSKPRRKSNGRNRTDEQVHPRGRIFEQNYQVVICVGKVHGRLRVECNFNDFSIIFQ